jgi:superfamily II DNA or RNA helicase
MDIKALLKQSNSWSEFKLKIDALPKKQMGNAFELLTKLYFKINPVYSFYDEVWLLSEVSSTVFEYLGLPSHDLGIDLIAKQGDEYHPIQCKYHSEKNSSITFNEVSTFISLLEGNDKFTQGYICSTANVTSKNLDKIKNKPINLILSDSWVQLDEDFFDKLRNYFEDRKYTPTAYIPKEHQVKALKDSVEYFIDGNNSRGKLIFPCGAGKSLTGFWMTQELKSTSTLIAVPSLSLVKQTLDVYLREIVARGIKVKWLCICSDEGIGKDDEIMENTESLGIPCQTNPDYIEKWLETNRDEHKIIFTTYQSGRIIADVSKKLNVSFDLGIFDEAHKTVGLNKKLFSYLLFDENIAIAKRIFMTATERFYSGSKEDIISMDDYEIYGNTFSQMSFKEAIEKELLTDYKIITIDVKKSEIAEFIKSNNLVQLNNKWKNETEARSLASMIALRKAMKVLPIKNAVSFHSSIDKAQRNKDLQSYITSTYNFEPIDSFTVSSKVATTKRNDIIREFADSSRALITNAKCLTEGVDVPNIDCIVFADPRKSKVDIVQALGRALRKKKGKDFGYVILPVLYDDETHEIDNENYNEIISIVRGLAANDERIIEYFKDKSEKTGAKRIEGSKLFDFNFTADLLDEKEFTTQLQIKIWESLSKFNWMDFEDAREYVNKLGIKNSKEWQEYCKSKNKPKNIPNRPDSTYINNGWIGWGDWYGTGRIANFNREFKEFYKAKEFVNSLNLKSTEEWIKYTKSNKLPIDIPTTPSNTYKGKGWISMGDWLGTGRIADKNKIFVPFDEARSFVHSLNLKSSAQWKEYINSNKKPNDIPSNPGQSYKGKGWIGMSDWLGHGKITNSDKKFKKFSEAKKIVHGLKLKNYKEWIDYCKSVDKPIDIPSQPSKVYKNDGYIDLGDWLGTFRVSSHKKEFLSFEDARDFVRKLNFQTITEWKDYCDSGKKPFNIPFQPAKVYKKDGFKSYIDWLGTNKISNSDRKYKTFEDARKYVQTLNLKSEKEWIQYHRKYKPEDIPSKPDRFYKNDGWKGIGDWLGTGKIANFNIVFRSFDDAKKFVHQLNLKNSDEWKKYVKSSEKPADIPSSPNITYKKNGWKGMGDWLGTNTINNSDKTFKNFSEAREFIRTLKIKNQKEWNLYCKSKKTIDIPSNPSKAYKNQGWIGWGDWLGTGTIAPSKREYVDFNTSKFHAINLNFNSVKEWNEYSKSGKRPSNIPSNPQNTYKNNGWKGWNDFLGKEK